ncbi:UNVERIFIED_CONTAM: hypothetical protein Scaly_2655800 [Sesamum calycinum]|uniref:Uncharacterized protein n=1 Tax=Sesamum calycinum TaxID=2727403 RepID=A0AAW2J8Y6_9LAMI
MNFLNSLCTLTHTTYTGLLENPNPNEASDEDDRGNDEIGGTMVESAGEDSDMGIMGKCSYTTSFNFNQFASLEEWVFDQGDVDSLALLEKLKDQWKWKFGDCMPHEEDIHRSTNPLHFVVERVATPFRGPPPQRLTWRQMFRCYQWGRWHRLLTPLTLLICLGFHILVHRCFKNQLLQKCMVSNAYPSPVEIMTWHANHQVEEGSMCYPSDVEAWRYFDWTHPDFAAEPHNVRLATQYNLPPGMCMSFEYMFLMMVITGPSNSKCLIDAYLEPLIEELQILWHVGVLTRDSTKDETFTMRTALIWIVNVLPTYGMASGWSTAGVVG